MLRPHCHQIEQANGFGPGYVSQVLHGSIMLTVRQLVGISLAIGKELGELCSGAPPEAADLAEIRRRMARFDAALEQLESQGLVKLPRRDSA